MAVLSMIVIMLFLLICFTAIIALLATILGIGSIGITSLISGIVLSLKGQKVEHSHILRIIGIILLIFGILYLFAFGLAIMFIFG